MVAWNIILMIIGILALLDSLVVFTFPKWAFKFSKKMVKTKKNLKKIAWTEFLIALIILLIGMNV